MSGKLAGKVALVTGGSVFSLGLGIGRAIALSLASEGASVIINYSRSEGPASEVVNQIGALAGGEGRSAIAFKANVSKLTEIKALVEQSVAKFGKIDILVLNAAGLFPNKSIETTTEADFDDAYNLNVKGPFFLVQTAAPHIPEGGRVIFISTSVTAVTSVAPPYLLYASTKGAIEQMNRVLAKDLGRRNVTVNVVSPGPVGTEAYFVGKTEEIVKLNASWAPANRIGEPEDIAKVVTFIASDASAWVNGQNIRVNGGMTV
ncbi:putative short chain type dehydrogenase [Cantharellus anzutake]|uniref:putative short chain type dehydrogenase n=1 Tax=Cantharellus anzutake TaxID=1750568 RepID=UPI00190403AF|nr:putative short chain type dehydrogenase [Cantharellus anzutake]KAF8332646.1 putative short chain type dehydrogenase [Cantharellus anzutake]